MSLTHWPDQVNLTQYVPASAEAQRAASLACGLIQIHSFQVGNKRTAELVVNEYLKAHGFSTRSPSSAQKDQEAHLKVASGKIDDTKLAEVYAQALDQSKYAQACGFLTSCLINGAINGSAGRFYSVYL